MDSPSFTRSLFGNKFCMHVMICGDGVVGVRNWEWIEVILSKSWFRHAVAPLEAK